MITRTIMRQWSNSLMINHPHLGSGMVLCIWNLINDEKWGGQVVIKESLLSCCFFFFTCLQDRDLGDEYGWKQVHGDVFRPSSHPLIFSSLIGSGCQIFSVSLIVIIVAMLEDLYTE